MNCGVVHCRWSCWGGQLRTLSPLDSFQMARSVWMWFKVSMALEWLLSEGARWRHPDRFLFRRFHHSAGHPSPCYLPDMKLNEVIFPFNNFLIKIIFNFLIIFSSVAGQMQIFVLLQVVNTQRRSYPHSPRHDRSHLLVKKPRKLHHQNRKYYQNASLWDAEKLLVLSPPRVGVEAEPDGVALEFIISFLFYLLNRYLPSVRTYANTEYDFQGCWESESVSVVVAVVKYQSEMLNGKKTI